MSNLTIGDSLTLDCSFTTVRGISSSVNFIWTTGGIEIRRVDNITADVLNDSAIYTDSFEIPSLSAIDNGRVYYCRVMINATQPVYGSNYFSVAFPGEYKMFMCSILSTICKLRTLFFCAVVNLDFVLLNFFVHTYVRTYMLNFQVLNI